MARQQQVLVMLFRGDTALNKYQ